MSRNANGTYTLPAGNPVVSGTTITTAWANATLSDIATEMTDSLDRSGKGGMLAQFKAFDGAAGAPGISWANELDSGIYRVALKDFKFQVNAVTVQEWTATSVAFPLGATAAPTAGNAVGFAGTGHGTGSGVTGTGGASDGSGVAGTGGATNGVGVRGVGTGTGIGLSGDGGASGGAGVQGTGGGVSATGVRGVGGAPNGPGVTGLGTGSGQGVFGFSAGSGVGIEGTATAAVGGKFTGGAGFASINIAPCAAPSTLQNGDMWVETGTNTLKVRISGTTKTVTLT